MRTSSLALKNAPLGNLRPREITCERFEATLALKRLTRMWTTPILLVLVDGEQRFAELRRELAPISAKVLTQRLKELEREGLIERRELISDPPKTVLYKLTPLGEAAKPMLCALMAWNRDMRAAGK